MHMTSDYRGALKLAAIRILKIANLDITSKEHEETPERFANLFESLLCRHTTDMPALKTFPSSNNELIVVGPTDFYSLCPHHLSLILGKAYIGYIPNGKVLGLSKIPRLVRWVAGSPVKQEDLTCQIAERLEFALFGKRTQAVTRSNGVAVVLQALHTCMFVRGARVNVNCVTSTSKMTGCFLDPKKQARAEFLALVNQKLG